MENSGGQCKENQGDRNRKKKKKQKREKTVEVKKVVEEWEIWNEEKKTTRLEEEAKKLVSEKFHQ